MAYFTKSSKQRRYSTFSRPNVTPFVNNWLISTSLATGCPSKEAHHGIIVRRKAEIICNENLRLSPLNSADL